tara:strand:+ start:223 stop:387 length:165 start_codon:yes stop_codon:yes gene_type:complete
MDLHEEELYLNQLIEKQIKYDLLTDIAAGFLALFVCFFIANILLEKYKKKDDYL